MLNKYPKQRTNQTIQPARYFGLAVTEFAAFVRGVGAGEFPFVLFSQMEMVQKLSAFKTAYALLRKEITMTYRVPSGSRFASHRLRALTGKHAESIGAGAFVVRADQHAARPVDSTVTTVVDLEQRRRAGGALDNPDRGSKHQHQFRVDANTRAFIKHLQRRAEAETISEVVRRALQDYELVLATYDEVRFSNDMVVGADGHRVQSDEVIWPRRHSLVTQGDDRIGFFLRDRGMARLQRLMKATGASSKSDVIRVALCVLDTILDDREAAISEGSEVAVLHGTGPDGEGDVFSHG